MASSGSWMEVSISLSNRVRQYSLPPWAPLSGEHRTIRERSWGHLGQDLPQSSESWVPVGHPERGPVKFIAAVFSFAAVEVQDMLLVAGE